MEWLHPSYMWCLLGLPLVLFLAWWAQRQRRASVVRFGTPHLVDQLAGTLRPSRRRWKQALRAIGILLVAVSLVGPRYGTEPRTIKRTGVDVVVALDVSASMRAEDVAPSRLDRAKRDIKRLLDQLGGDRVGLVLFAGDGFVQCPLTTDYNAVRLFLDVAGPKQMPTPGTNLEAAFRAAQQAFETRRPSGADTTVTRRTRAMLVVSDGENHQGAIDDVRAEAEEHDVMIFAAGVGSTRGAPIPTYRKGQRVGVKRTPLGQPVRTRLNETMLRRLAGPDRYVRIGATGTTLTDVATTLNRLEGTTIAEEEYAAYRELYMWPLALGLLVLIVDVLLPVRRRHPSAGNRTEALVV